MPIRQRQKQFMIRHKYCRRSFQHKYLRQRLRLSLNLKIRIVLLDYISVDLNVVRKNRRREKREFPWKNILENMQINRQEKMKKTKREYTKQEYFHVSVNKNAECQLSYSLD